MATLATLSVKIIGDTGQLVSSLDRAQKRSKSFTEGLRRARGPLLAMTGAAVGLGGAVIKTFGDFDQAMTQSLAIMGDVSETMRTDMVAAAEEVGKTTTFSARDAAESFFFLASAGLDAKASIEALPSVAGFAQAGMFDMARATDLLTDAQSALGLTIRDDAVANMENMVRVSDTLVKANTLANASVEQFSEALTNKAGAALRLVGKDVEEGVAVLAAFADQGVKGSEAGTQLGIVMRDLQTKALQNTSAFEKQNIAVFDAQGEMRNFADILSDLEKNMDGASDATKKATLLNLGFSDKSVAALQTIIGMSDAIAEYEAKLRDAGGTTQAVADKQLEAFNAQMKIARDRVAIAAAKLGAKFAPAVLKIVDVLAQATDWFSKLDSKTIGVIATVIAVTAAVGALGLIIPPLVAGFGALAAIFGVITSVGALFTTALWANVAAWIALNVVTGGILIAIGALIAGLVFMATHWDETKQAAETAINFIINAFEGLVNKFIEGLNEIVSAYNDTLGKIFGELGEIAEVAFGRVEFASDDAKDAIVEDVDEFEKVSLDAYSNLERNFGDFTSSVIENSDAMTTEVVDDITTLGDRMSEFADTRLEREQDVQAKLQFMILNSSKMFGEGEAENLDMFIKNRELMLDAFELFQQGFITIDDAIKQVELEHLEEVEQLRRKNLEQRIKDEEAAAALLTKIKEDEFDALRKAVGLLPSVIRSDINAPLRNVGAEAAGVLNQIGPSAFFDPVTGRFVSETVTGDFTFIGGPLFGSEEEAKAARDALNARLNPPIIVEIHTPAVLGNNVEEVIADGVVRGVERGLFPEDLF